MERLAPERLIEQADWWFTKNAVEIERIMQAFSDRSLTFSDAWTTAEIAIRSLSEQPICRCLSDVARLMPLSGFALLSPADGWVEIGYPALGEPGHDGIIRGREDRGFC